MSNNADEAFARNTYFDHSLGMNAVKLLPGEYHVSNKDLVQVTVLGSCVAACIRDRESGIGGMNHFMLPDSGGENSTRYGVASRYGVHAMEILINELIKLGGRRTHFEAKVFGGGNVMNSLSSTHVGRRNAEFVLEFLHTERIPVIAKDLVDIHPRKVYHFPQTGRVRVKKLFKLGNETLLDRERAYRAQLVQTEVGGEVELFS